MKKISRLFLMGMILCGGILPTRAADPPDIEIVSIELSDQSGCDAYREIQMEVISKPAGWDIVLETNMAPGTKLRGELPKQMVMEYVNRLRQTDFMYLKEEYEGISPTTAHSAGNFSIRYNEKGRPGLVEVKYYNPDQCPAELSKVFDIIWELQDYATGSATSLRCEEPSVVRESVILLAGVLGHRKGRDRVIRSSVLNNKSDELVNALLELQNKDSGVLAEAWYMDSSAVESLLRRALSHVREMQLQLRNR